MGPVRALMTVSLLVSAALVPAGSAQASTDPPPRSCESPHCYSNTFYNGADWIGAYGTWPRNNLIISPSWGDAYAHVNSEMWFVLDNGNYIETGIRNGSDVGAVSGGCGCVAYDIFWSDHRIVAGMDNEYEHIVEHTTPTGATDTYGIVRKPNATNDWYIKFNGNIVGGSAITGDWTGNLLEQGGELQQTTCASAAGAAATFPMIVQVQNFNYAWVYPTGESSNVDTFCGMTGTYYGSGQWTWNKGNPPGAAAIASPSAGQAALAGAEANTCLGSQCNQAAYNERVSDFSPAQSGNTGVVSSAPLVAASLSAAQSPSGQTLSAAAQVHIATSTVLSTMGAFDQEHGLMDDPLIPANRAVWIVTVHGNMTTDAAPGRSASVRNVYTDVYDAPTGSIILRAIGVSG